jgi:molecular chaperone HscC
VLVFDLGGGTFDVTLMEVFEGTLEIVSTAGESHLGGEDFTDRIVTWALRENGLEPEPTEAREPLRVARLREQCERAKRVLATGAAAHVELAFPDARGELAENAPRLALDAERFRALTADLVERLKGPVGRVLRDGRTAPGNVDDVILVGGATRMSVVQALVRELFGREPLVKFNPDEVVAYGAAVQSALIANDCSVADMVMTDVCPFTLGIETSRKLGTELRDGYFMPVIHRNTTIPVSREVAVFTVYPNQRSMTVHVYQGEARRVRDNLRIGQLEVKNIPLGAEEQEVRIRFTYDLNGILEVEAVVSETGQRTQTVLTHNVQGLSKEDVRRAVKNLQKLKFYPRDELVHRQLLLFAERVVGEIDPYRRDGLEQVLAAFEYAMHAGDREFFGQTRQALLVTLSALGFSFDPQKGGDGGDARAA